MNFDSYSDIALFVGLSWIVTTLVLLFISLNRKKKGYNTSGEIVDVVGEWSRGGGRSSYSYRPIVRFIDENGQSVSQKSEFGLFPNIWQKGKVIPIVILDDEVYPTDLSYTVFYFSFVMLICASIPLYILWQSFNGGL